MASSPNLGGLVPPSQEGPATPIDTFEQIRREAPRDLDRGLDFLRKLTKRLELEDEATDRSLYRKWFRNCKYYEGEQLGRWSEVTGQWRSYQPQVGDPYYIHPEFRYHSDAITTQWVQSRPDLRVLPANDQDETVAKARAASQVLDHYEEILLDEEFLQREGKLGQLTGQMYRYTYWDPTKGRQVQRQSFEPHEVELSPEHYQCPDCGSVGHPDELSESPMEEQGETPQQEAAEHGGPVCPDCGSPSVQVNPAQTAIQHLPVPLGSFPIGDIVTECVPAFQVKFDRSQAAFEQATFLRRRRIIRPELVKQVLPWWEPPTTHGKDEDPGMRAERLLKQSTGQAGYSYGVDSRLTVMAGVVVSQWWLEPCLYANHPPEPEDIQFANGLTIPAGVPLIQVFPSGLYLLIIDDRILDMREECLHDHWQHTPFILIPTRAEGDGIEDLCEPQREVNDLNSLVYTDAKANSAPPTIVNTTFGLKTTDVAGKPHWVVPARIPTGESIDNAVRPIQGRAMPSHVFNYINMMRGSMQLYAKSFSSSTGAPDVADVGGINTATGAQLMATNAQSMRAPELAIRAKGTVVWARQVLHLFQKNAIDQHYIPIRGRYGVMEGNYFKGADIDADFIISVRRRSWMPRNEMDRRSDLLTFLQAGGLNPQFPRPVRDAMAEYFNIDLDLTPEIADIRICRMRLEQMRQLLAALAEQAPPEALPLLLTQSVPIEPLSDNHQVDIEWWKEWLKTDEGLMSPPPLRQAANLKIQQHKEAMMMELQEQGLMQFSMAAGPQAITQGFQAGQQETQQAQQNEHELAKEKVKAQNQPKGN